MIELLKKMLMIISFDVVSKHVSANLNKGKNKLEAAKLLRESEMYDESITLYIKAYEEISQAAFFMATYSDKPEITEDDWNKLINQEKVNDFTRNLMDEYL